MGRDRLDQVITNLVSNAIKYGAGKPIEIEVGAARRGAFVTVAGHGIGIAPEHQSRFRRFERAVSSKHFWGMCLGLWIAREIIERLGGRIRVSSELGRGATSTVELPRRARVVPASVLGELAAASAA